MDPERERERERARGPLGAHRYLPWLSMGVVRNLEIFMEIYRGGADGRRAEDGCGWGAPAGQWTGTGGSRQEAFAHKFN